MKASNPNQHICFKLVTTTMDNYRPLIWLSTLTTFSPRVSSDTVIIAIKNSDRLVNLFSFDNVLNYLPIKVPCQIFF